MGGGTPEEEQEAPGFTFIFGHYPLFSMESVVSPRTGRDIHAVLRDSAAVGGVGIVPGCGWVSLHGMIVQGFTLHTYLACSFICFAIVILACRWSAYFCGHVHDGLGDR